MVGIIEYLKVVLIVQLFYAFSMTLLVYALAASPYGAIANIADFEAPADEFSMRYIGDQVGTNVLRQVSLPEVDLATLIFYSGNIVLDLLLNFATAVPQMFTLLISSFLLFFNLDAVIAGTIITFIWVMVTMLYVIAIVMFLLGIRSQGTLV